jgi:hypothetical protein
MTAVRSACGARASTGRLFARARPYFADVPSGSALMGEVREPAARAIGAGSAGSIAIANA